MVSSSGHGLFVRGAIGIIDEADEARCVTGQGCGNPLSGGYMYSNCLINQWPD